MAGGGNDYACPFLITHPRPHGAAFAALRARLAAPPYSLTRGERTLRGTRAPKGPRPKRVAGGGSDYACPNFLEGDQGTGSGVGSADGSGRGPVGRTSQGLGK
jgi:hypothetical protein